MFLSHSKNNRALPVRGDWGSCGGAGRRKGRANCTNGQEVSQNDNIAYSALKRGRGLFIFGSASAPIVVKWPTGKTSRSVTAHADLRLDSRLVLKRLEEIWNS